MNATLRLPRRLQLAAMALCAVGFAGATQAQTGNVAVNTTGASANPVAILDVSSLTQGLFIPRMNALPSNPATLPQGLTVFRTGAANVRGLWAVDYGQWMPLSTGPAGWDIYGNYLTNAANPNVDFIGTKDNRPMYFKTNNADRMRIDATTGYVGVGWAAADPAFKERLDINGAIRQYYVPGGGVETSNTNQPGVFRYQTRGTWVGTGLYRYGLNEKLATSPNNTTVNLAVLGSTNSYPLQYAGHWGNVGDTTMFQGTNTPVLKQPRTNGWRLFENPYTEVNNQSWTHFRESQCGAGTSIIPSAVLTPYTLSNTVVTGAPNPGLNDIVTPFICYDGGRPYMRRQYLFRAEELNMELAQLNGNPNATNGLCAGQPITSISFWVKSNVQRSFLNPVNASLTVRQAPLGLTELTGFDNTPDYDGTISCGAMPTVWPPVAVGTSNWTTINLAPAFVWDGVSNIIVEVAIRYQVGSTNVQNNPVGVTNTTFNATYGASCTGPPSPLVAFTTPPFSCTNGNLCVATQLPNTSVTSGWVSGSSVWRPIIRFNGTVTTASAAPTSGTNNANYILYHNALVLEDTSVTANGIPFGRWRTNFPVGNAFFAYQGRGTISAQKGVFDNGSRLNDHVFDRAFDGRVAPSDAAHFGGQRLLSIDEMESFTRENRHLPTMKGREAWNEKGGFSLGDLTNQLWATTETHALYVADLHDKLNVIEMLTNERPITTREFQLAQQDLGAMTDLTDAEKSSLIASLRKRVTLTSTSR